MDRLNPYIIVFFGAGVGGVARHALNNAMPNVVRRRVSLGDADHQRNGLAASWAFSSAGWRSGRATGWSQHIRLFVATGVLGGYTTFSTFSLELSC